MIVDTTLFNDEFDMLDIHLSITKSYVDRWIILEGNKTWSGIPKLYNLTENLGRYAKYRDRIDVITLDIPEDYVNWQCENYSRAALQQSIDKLNEELKELKHMLNDSFEDSNKITNGYDNPETMKKELPVLQSSRQVGFVAFYSSIDRTEVL